MERSATINWKGSLKSGQGLITTKSRALLEVPFTYGTRFKDEIGTNPEELIAAAHASCFSMALSGEIGKENLTVQNINTQVTISFENINDTWSIRTSHLEVLADIPGLSESRFSELAENAKNNCPISRLLNTKITINARLWSKEKITSSPPPPGEL